MASGVEELLDMLFEMIDEAKNAPPNVTSVVNVNSHLRPVELRISILARWSPRNCASSVLPPCTNMRNTSKPPRSEIMHHQ